MTTPKRLEMYLEQGDGCCNVYVCESEDRAKGELYSFVEEYWNEMPEAIGAIPEDRDLAIQIYFEQKDGDETYEIQSLPILSTKIEV